MTTRRAHRLFAAALVAVLALVGAACSDDGGDDDATTTSSTTERPAGTDDSTTTDDADDTSTTEPDGTTTTAPEDDTTTTDPGGEGRGDLTSRLPEIAGYEREIDDDDDDDDDNISVSEEHCDGTTPSLQPVEEATAEYAEEGDAPEGFLAITATRFASAQDATAAYDEFVGITSGCRAEGIEVDEGAPAAIGDEAMSWELTVNAQAAGTVYAARSGDEIWFLSAYGEGDLVDEAVLAAFTSAAEG